MARIVTGHDLLAERTNYHLMRRAQASIAGYLNFGNGDLLKYLDRPAFREMADKLAAHFFHLSRDLVFFEQVKELYAVHLVLAPVIQRLHLSAGYDWHRGHLLGFIRRNTSGRVKRFHFGLREVKRSFQPDLLSANLEQIGVHDGGMVELLADIHRRHAGGTTLRDQLAHQIFDPILLLNQKEGYELRHGNRLIRMEKAPYPGSIDLRNEAARVLDFRIRSQKNKNGRHLEIAVADECLKAFRSMVEVTVSSSSNPEFKLQKVDICIRDFVEKTRHARSALPQVKELKLWLAAKLRGLSGNNADAKHLPNILVDRWLKRVDNELYIKGPNFFWDHKIHSEETYMKFFSPYREV